MHMTLAELVENLIPVAKSAGDEIMRIYKKIPESETKQDGSPVTEADKAAEAIILPALKKFAPNIEIISEENVKSHSIAAPEQFFLVDPLDGTREFLKRDGKGSFTVNIALIKNGAPILGVVYAPALKRLFSGVVGQEAHEDQSGINVRSTPGDGIVAVASISHRDQQTNDWLTNKGISKTVSIGSSLKFCLLACGEADVYPRFGPTMEWDTAAGDAILRAAGGTVENPDGSRLVYGKPGYKNTAFIAHSGCLNDT